MQASPELNALVAVEVMGWLPPPCLIPNSREGRWESLPYIEPQQTMGHAQLLRHKATGYVTDYLTFLHDAYWKTPGGGWHYDPLPYSTDMAAAWEVLEKLKADGWSYAVIWEKPATRFRCRLWRWHGAGVERHKRESTEYGNTAPLAICLAALEAVRSSEQHSQHA